MDVLGYHCILMEEFSILISNTHRPVSCLGRETPPFSKEYFFVHANEQKQEDNFKKLGVIKASTTEEIWIS